MNISVASLKTQFIDQEKIFAGLACVAFPSVSGARNGMQSATIVSVILKSFRWGTWPSIYRVIQEKKAILNKN